MVEIKNQCAYYITCFITKFESMDEVRLRFPELIAAHISRSNRLHKEGKLLMAGAFRNNSGEPVTTMAIFYSREDAEKYAKDDPFVLEDMVSEWHVKEWANMLEE
jgi:uncharacterized protein YciI